ncbi:hypothetical protein ACF08M_38000 [Streptomyces sp. NPDC015032]|uniref:hypothetical protein n=1 Tax=Streptomyces sp. NPDC015032 TaxID=3364937 RepID=UPI0036FEFEFD
MTDALRPPGDPSELHLRISFADALLDTPHADALERWDVAVLHGHGVHDGSRCPAAPGECATLLCPAYARDGIEVGSMTFFRVHVDRGQNAFWALEEETEELYEIARAVLDPDTGNFNESANEELEYVGSGLLVMDRVTLDEDWRGHGLGVVLALEAILRLMPGCRAIVCSPGVTDLTGARLRDQAEWERVTAKITRGWEGLGFRHHQGTVYLLSPASEVLEAQRDVLRRRLAALGASWRAAQSVAS